MNDRLGSDFAHQGCTPKGGEALGLHGVDRAGIRRTGRGGTKKGPADGDVRRRTCRPFEQVQHRDPVLRARRVTRIGPEAD